MESYSFMRDTLLGVMERSTVQLILPKERYSSINGAVSGFFFFLLIVDFSEKLFCWSSWYLSDTRAMWQLSVSVLQGHKWTEISFLLLSSTVAWSLNSSDCHQFGKWFIYTYIYIIIVWEWTRTSTWPLLGNRSQEWFKGFERLKYCCLKVHYILGSTGRSFVVGYGVNPPTHCHHRGASCYGPNR